VTSSQFVKSVEEQIEPTGSVHTTTCGVAVASVVACNISRPPPNLSSVVMLQLFFPASFSSFFLVVPCLAQFPLQLTSHLTELDFVSISKGFLLLVQKSFDVAGYLRLVVREAMSSLGWYDSVCRS